VCSSCEQHHSNGNDAKTRKAFGRRRSRAAPLQQAFSGRLRASELDRYTDCSKLAAERIFELRFLLTR
jgi:hypothetical protein